MDPDLRLVEASASVPSGAFSVAMVVVADLGSWVTVATFCASTGRVRVRRTVHMATA